MENKQTAVQWLVQQLNRNVVDLDGYPYEEIALPTIEIALKMEREQHGRTWDNAIHANEKRGYNLSRSIVDFDNYYTETYGE